MSYNKNCTLSDHRTFDDLSTYATNGMPNSTDITEQIDPFVLNIVECFFESQFALKGIKYIPLTTARRNNLSKSCTETNKIATALNALGEAYIRKFEKNVTEMVDVLGMQKSDNIHKLFESISNELYVEGVKWSHIVTHFVYSVEFAHYASRNGITENNVIAQWLALFITQRLLLWITDNGNWVYMNFVLLFFVYETIL